MIELIEPAARSGPGRVAVATHDDELAYGPLLDRARSVAAALVSQQVDRFAVADHDAETVLAHLAGASLAGAEACVYPPAEPDEIAELAGRFDHRVIVTDRPDLDRLDARRVGTTGGPATPYPPPQRSRPLAARTSS